MRKQDRTRKGSAAMEFALLLPMVAILLFLLTEGSNAMHTYQAMVEASREGARLVLMEGQEANVDVLIQSLSKDLDPAHLQTNVTTDPVGNTVTVEVSYDYQAIWSEDVVELLSGSRTLQFTAGTTMPMP